ncbi:hypothetical protein M378DRAFT_854442 [Amanita muscaria Koide BX008]|uniref:Uncharacterized protein n=1 Tax=Amanita muscaria (strain Koide BX008) TaxID=946122 RepID=A0A0C2T4U9_AMAMK|nr:hypothetical protein M378DRAFT_854442 [Amanita muscaria Koide BX008]
MITDWMGSWWTGQPHRPSPITPIDSNTSSVTAAPPSETTSPGLAVVKQPNQAKRRRTTKSAFGTLGISILNPTTVTAPTVEITSTASTSATVDSATSTTNDYSSIVVLTSPLLRTMFSAPLALAEPRLTATSAELMTEGPNAKPRRYG